MPLRYDEIEQVKDITREIAKEEIEAMTKALEVRVKDLEAKSVKLKEFAEELGRQIRNLVTEDKVRSMLAELKRELQKPEKPVTKTFPRK